MASSSNTSSPVPMAHGPAQMARPLPGIRLLGEPIHRVTEQEANRHILDALADGRGGWVATHNLDHLRRLLADRAFADLCATADLRTADGLPLIWASRLRGTPLPKRVAGSDMTLSLTEAAAREGRSIYLLGGNPAQGPDRPATAEVAAQMLAARFPGLKVAGWYCPPFGYDKNPQEMAQILARVAAARPDIVYVAVGSPKQELLIRELLKVHARGWYLGVGISLSFVTGEVPRAPQWMRRWGLEWVHRLSQEPRRLFRRYLIEGIPFAIRLLLVSAAERWQARPAG